MANAQIRTLQSRRRLSVDVVQPPPEPAEAGTLPPADTSNSIDASQHTDTLPTGSMACNRMSVESKLRQTDGPLHDGQSSSSTIPEEPSFSPQLPVNTLPPTNEPQNLESRQPSVHNVQCDEFFKKLLSDDVKTAHANAQAIVLKATSGEILNNALNLLGMLPSELAETSSGPYMSIKEVLACSASLEMVKEHCHASTQWFNLYRQQVMIFETRMSASVTNLIDHDCQTIVQKICKGIEGGVQHLPALIAQLKMTPSDWLMRLAIKLAIFVRTGVAVTACSTEFFKPDQHPPRKFWEEPSAVIKRKNLAPNKIEHTVLFYLRSVLHCWFGHAQPFTAQARSALVLRLVRHLGTGCLLLPEIWTLYTELPSWLFTSECPKLKDANGSTTSRFEERFLDSMVAAIDFYDEHERREQMDALEVLYATLQAQTQTHTEKLFATMTKKSSLHRLLNTTSVSLPLTSQNNSASAREANTPSSQPAVSDSLPSDPHPSLSSSPHSSAITALIAFLEDSYIVAERLHNSNHDPTSLTRAQRFINTIPDFYMSLREDAPCQWIFRQLITPEFARTREGFFSLQVFRHIHFNSGAFRDYPSDQRKGMFSTHEEYEEYLTDVRAYFPGKKETYFCNKKAIGNCIND
ncbi:hypothetical protein BDY19DRAFT_998783 [Irpex rosettiformis]|uniref:Uncharacterized protein n=1 Tax=Irpex rosettiformis TaxID=378272 RepID=A0ACB8TMH3_9APHY|nr:hypothetical protein BDY19DRAFT_998783 [Irpex rosettiformis]